MTNPRPIRIVHVVTELGPAGGGVASWLRQVLRSIDRGRFHFDFLVHGASPAPEEDEVRALGSRVWRCPRPLYLWKYPWALVRTLRRAGPYDIIHSHVLFSGLVLRLARLAGVPIRIAHSHSDVGGFRVDGDPIRGPVIGWMNRWLARDATLRLACSRRAAAALFGRLPGPTPRLVYYGIDLTPFAASVDRVAIRAELGLPADAFVVGHVGRFQPQKNHEFLIEIAAALREREPRARLLLVGDGPLRPAMERRVRDRGLGAAVVFAGARSDVPRLMLGAMDVFVLPSHYEGLPLVGIEAQAAGLPCVLSDVITEELDVVPGLIGRMALGRPAADWAQAILGRRRERSSEAAREALERVRSSAFNMEQGVRLLEAIYEEVGSRRGVGSGSR
ncbi:MAG: glycosyltransferase [Gemmataceae bacterium]|nr:glycosyltransferase [Gemmataceae bacterium]MDW8267110.1 glycosyltransferase [Gemmataceae bacterium]